MRPTPTSLLLIVLNSQMLANETSEGEMLRYGDFSKLPRTQYKKECLKGTLEYYNFLAVWRKSHFRRAMAGQKNGILQ